jgi:hypothetical protein
MISKSVEFPENQVFRLITLYDGATLCAFIFLYFIRFFTLSVPAVVEL